MSTITSESADKIRKYFTSDKTAKPESKPVQAGDNGRGEQRMNQTGQERKQPSGKTPDVRDRTGQLIVSPDGAMTQEAVTEAAQIIPAMRTATAAQIMAGEKDAQITAVEMTTTVAAVLNRDGQKNFGDRSGGPEKQRR